MSSIDPLVFSAFWMGIVSALALPLGALTAFAWHLPTRVVAAMMAFGGGALLAALSVDLVAPALAQGHYTELFVGFLAGGLLFIGLNAAVNDAGGFKRKISTSVHHSRRETRRRLRHILSHLDRTPIFQGLSREEFSTLAETIEPHFLPRGSRLYQQGDPADALYVVVKGKVSIWDELAGGPGDADQQPIDCIHGGGAFGANSLFTGSAHRYAATAVEDTWMWRIPETSLRHLLGESATFQQTIRQWLRDPRIRRYLVEEKGISEIGADAWFEEANAVLDAEARLPDAKPVDRHPEGFRAVADHIDRVPWLQDLSRDEIDWLSLHLVYRRYRPGEILFKQGEPAGRFFLLETGSVTLVDSDNQLLPSRLRAGDGIGMRSFLTGVRHTVTAQAQSECGAWILRREDFRQLLSNYPDMRHRLLAYLKDAGISAYLRQRYQLDGGRIQDWLSRARKAVTAGKLPPSLLTMGVESTGHGGASLAIWLGILLDGIPESLVIGASLMPTGISLSLLVGLFLANYPEALSSSRGMLEENYSRKRILLMWTSIMLLTGVGAAFGTIVMEVANPALLPFLEGLAAGAMLTMIAQTMLPEAYIKGGSIVGFSTLMGFLCAISMKAL